MNTSLKEDGKPNHETPRISPAPAGILPVTFHFYEAKLVLLISGYSTEANPTIRNHKRDSFIPLPEKIVKKMFYSSSATEQSERNEG